MSATSPRPGGGGPDPVTVMLWLTVLSIVTAVGVIAGAVHLGHELAGLRGPPPPPGPFAVVVDLAQGEISWTRESTLVAVAEVAALALAGYGATKLGQRWRRRRPDVDRAARRMGRPHELTALRRKGATATAKRFGIDDGSPGLTIGRTVTRDHELLYQGWEDVSVDIWGPRTGKTTSRAIPAILEAPGAVVATSNKRDLVDATRRPRSASGRVWVFDPQRVVGEPPDWWWNPLTYVVDEVTAAIMANVFVAAKRDRTAQTDAYFDSAGETLLANLLLAAAVEDRPITQVYLWLTQPTDDEPVLILRDHGHELASAAIAGVVHAPEKQRGGVYGTAQQVASFLTDQQALRWVTPSGPDDARPQLNAADFVRTSDTLYSISKEGRGSAGPLVAAMTVAVTEAAEDYAKLSRSGRLPVPMVAVLDEAANVCRWPELPNIYSHYGSRGICMMTILQSWSQGVEVWGRDGMRKLWSAANVKLFGGGVSEAEFLGEVSQLVGEYDLRSVTMSYGRSYGSSHSTRPEKRLQVSDLASMPRGRALLLASGIPATIVRTLPWMEGPHARAVRASISAHEPQAAGSAA